MDFHGKSLEGVGSLSLSLHGISLEGLISLFPSAFPDWVFAVLVTLTENDQLMLRVKKLQPDHAL